MKTFILLILLFQISCSAFSSFATGFAGNIASDTINREIEKRSECKNPNGN